MTTYFAAPTTIIGYGPIVGNDYSPFRINVADLNNDGYQDIVIASYSSTSVTILLGYGDGRMRAPSSFFIGEYYPGGLAVVDFNKDNKIDVLIAGRFPARNLALLLGNGDGTLQTPRSFGFADTFYNIIPVDLNRDNNVDVVMTTGFAAGALLFTSIESAPVKALLGGSASSSPNVQIGNADFNKDGYQDIISASSRVLSLYLGNGNGGT